jgi:hypothetical protein
MPTPNSNIDPDNTETPEDGTTVVVPDKKTDWEAAYKGLQATYNKLQTSSAKAVTDLQNRIKALEIEGETSNATILKHESAIAIKDHEIATLTKSIGDEKAVTSKTSKELTRSRMILKEFADLSPFEADGILPEAETEDDLRLKLTNFRKVLSKATKTTELEKIEGAGPKSPPPSKTDGGPAETEDLIWQKLSEFAGHDMAKYNEWLAKWDAVQAMKKQQK